MVEPQPVAACPRPLTERAAASAPKDFLGVRDAADQGPAAVNRRDREVEV